MFKKISFLVCCFIANLGFCATISTLINSSSYTQILGPGGTGYLLSAYQPMQCAFATTIPAPTVVSHTIQQMQQISIDSIGSGVYLWCKSNAAGLNYATTTPAADAATWGNSSGGGSSGNVNINQVGGASYALGQATMSASMPVVLSSNQSAVAISAASLPLPAGAATNLGIAGAGSKTLTDINTTLGTPLQAGGNVVVTSAPTTAVTNAGLSNLDVALSSRLKPADTLAAVTTVGTITNPVAVTGTFWQATQPVNGAVTANIGTSGSLALDASVTALEVSQASTTSGQNGALIQGAVTTFTPTYTNAQTSPLSLNPNGALRVVDAPAGTPSGHSGTITSGGVSQTLMAGNANRRKYRLQNTDTTAELLCINDTGGAAIVGGADSYCLSPATATTAGGYYESESTAAITIIAGTTGHKFSASEY